MENKPWGYFHEESWKPHNGWKGRDGGEGESTPGWAVKGKGSLAKVCS